MTPDRAPAAAPGPPAAAPKRVVRAYRARDVTGTARLKLDKGNVTVVGRRSPRSLYRTDFATFEPDSVYRPRDAEGFIKLRDQR